ncbi:reverse transcriptase domain, reverse transcriptase zinc-binding domain protein [Tanacetum coccineum]
MSVLVNGSPTEEFDLERGVRQGDPLSHFLFILATEGLNAIITKAEQNGIFSGVKVGANNVIMSHLQYADDTIFFGEWNKENAKSLLCILKCFEEVFGLRVNFNKSKWRWRFRNEGGSLWVRVIKSIHWENGRLDDYRELEGLGIEFTTSCKGVLGDGRRKEGSVMDKGSDRWKWMIFDDGEYKVNELSSMIEEKILHMDSGGQETLWNKLVPKKINIFVWRALKGRLPVRDELDKRALQVKWFASINDVLVVLVVLLDAIRVFGS